MAIKQCPYPNCNKAPMVWIQLWNKWVCPLHVASYVEGIGMLTDKLVLLDMSVNPELVVTSLIEQYNLHKGPDFGKLLGSHQCNRCGALFSRAYDCEFVVLTRMCDSCIDAFIASRSGNEFYNLEVESET